MAGLLATHKPSILSTLRLDVFELTNDPPHLISINTVEIDQESVALDFRVTLRGDSNVVILAAARAFRASVRVQDLEVDATIRLLLSPLSCNPPFLKALSISFVGKPRLSYALQGNSFSIVCEHSIRLCLAFVLMCISFVFC